MTVIQICCTYNHNLNRSLPSLCHNEPYLYEAINTHTFCRCIVYKKKNFSHQSMCTESHSKHIFDPVWVAANMAGIMRPTYWCTDPAANKSSWHKANPTHYESQSNRRWNWAMRDSSPEYYFHIVAHQCSAQWSLTVLHLPVCSVCVDHSLTYKPKVFFHQWSANSKQSWLHF